MRLPIYQIDAFTDRLFAGNPAAVVPLETWLPDATLQAIAAENNLAETAFFLRESPDYALRWFTPAVEVDLCGHATLASAHVIFERLEPRLEKGGVSHAQSGDADGHAAGRGPGDGFSGAPAAPGRAAARARGGVGCAARRSAGRARSRRRL
jgi:predicted PhzF superfamily epimerase YddE/YHI9